MPAGLAPCAPFSSPSPSKLVTSEVCGAGFDEGLADGLDDGLGFVDVVGDEDDPAGVGFVGGAIEASLR